MSESARAPVPAIGFDSLPPMFWHDLNLIFFFFFLVNAVVGTRQGSLPQLKPEI
jgi:hypothetical protein